MNKVLMYFLVENKPAYTASVLVIGEITCHIYCLTEMQNNSRNPQSSLMLFT